MWKRDLGILLLVAFIVFFSFHESWYHLADEDFPIKYEADHLLPPPRRHSPVVAPVWPSRAWPCCSAGRRAVGGTRRAVGGDLPVAVPA